MLGDDLPTANSALLLTAGSRANEAHPVRVASGEGREAVHGEERATSQLHSFTPWKCVSDVSCRDVSCRAVPCPVAA